MVSIGKRWATYADSITIGERQYKFCPLSGATKDAHGCVWPSREAYVEHCELKRAWRAFQRGVSTKIKSPEGITTARLTEIARELGFQLEEIPVSNAISKIR